MRKIALFTGGIVCIVSLWVCMELILFNPLIIVALSDNEGVASDISSFIIHDTPLPSMPYRETVHMYDVQQLYQIFSLVFLFFGWLLFILIIIHLYKSSTNTWHLIWKSASWVMGGCAGVLGVGLITFPLAFDVFHRVLFRNDYWILSPHSILIQAFPERFFISMAVATFLYMVACCLIFWNLSRWNNGDYLRKRQ